MEIRRTHHSRWRMLGKEWKLRTEKGWITWIEQMEIQIVRQGESICYNVFGARNMDNIAGEFGNVG